MQNPTYAIKKNKPPLPFDFIRNQIENSPKIIKNAMSIL
jgi:hypothetical protein